MIYKLILPLILTAFTSNIVFGQKTLFDSLKVDHKTKIIGRVHHLDKNSPYEKYNFILDDSAKIANFINHIELGQVVRNSMEYQNFKITVVKDYKEIGSWTINPTLKSAMTHDGKTYEFDLNQIADFNKSDPFKFKYEVKEFKSKIEYESYLLEQKKNSDFLFDYSPQFKYEGSFEIEFKKPLYSSPKEISEYLTPLIEAIVGKDEYSVGYILNEKNMSKSDQYTMTIQGPKKLFDALKIENLLNENWKETIEKAYFFYRE